MVFDRLISQRQGAPEVTGAGTKVTGLVQGGVYDVRPGRSTQRR